MGKAAAAAVEMPTVEQQRETFATSGLMVVGKNDDPRKMKSSDPKQVSYINKLVSSQQRIDMMGEQPVSVINLNPYSLEVNGVLFAGMRVPANKPGEEFFAMVIRDVKYQVDTGIDRNHSPVEFWPIQLASEFETQYAEKGGVFIIRGDLQKNPELEHTAEFKAKYAAARETMLKHCMKLKNQGDNEWNTPQRSGARNIHAPHRQAVQILLDAGAISKAPEWFDTAKKVEQPLPSCICGADVKKGALICGTCGYVLDPFTAFQRGILKEQDVALERLTRAQVEQLGVSAFVAETIDEAPERRAKGLPKPLSKFELQQMKERDKEQASK